MKIIGVLLLLIFVVGLISLLTSSLSFNYGFVFCLALSAAGGVFCLTRSS